MPLPSPAALRALVALALAVTVVGVSARYDRISSERIIYNDECTFGPDPQACLEPREVAGWPFAFVFDTPGISVEHDAHPYDDEVRALPYLASVAAVALAVLVVWAGWRRWRRGAPVRPPRRAPVVGTAAALGAQVLAFVVRQPILNRGDWTGAERFAFEVADAVLWPSFVAGAAVLGIVGMALSVVALALGVGAAVALARAKSTGPDVPPSPTAPPP